MSMNSEAKTDKIILEYIPIELTKLHQKFQTSIMNRSRKNHDLDGHTDVWDYRVSSLLKMTQSIYFISLYMTFYLISCI